MPLNVRFLIPVLIFSALISVRTTPGPAAADERDTEGREQKECQEDRDDDDISKSDRVFNSPTNLVEWFGMNLGAGYVNDASAFGRIDLHFFTISRRDWYYTVLEGSPFYDVGIAGVWGRAGWQRFVKPDFAIRVGMRIGLSFWLETYEDSGEDELAEELGIETAPHVQLIWFLSHGSVGLGLDIPVVFGITDREGIGDIFIFGSSFARHQITGGIQVYFRWTVF